MIFETPDDVPQTFPTNLKPLVALKGPMDGAKSDPKARYFCSICDKAYTRAMSVKTHIIATHSVSKADFESQKCGNRVIWCGVDVETLSKPVDPTMPRLKHLVRLPTDQ
jgi:hypothetical protein